ncbi:unnamed protein product [Rotaria socialis]|uniref:Uncharacterized protein n=1 Tax=Rotaria socialis TaxID=392032 RepID=A0A818J6D8_9BILA|nr:unnamed protein product [Rotaria socialis]CAF4656647.1 unnamed protein product [Rotaria socialis]
MAGVIQYFRDEFLPVHQNAEYIDRSSLVQKLKNFTPILLQCTKPEESVQNMPAVVIMNFSSNYGEKLKISFLNKGFTALANIIQRNGSNIHARAQLTLMVHITKMEMQLWLVVLLFMKIEDLSARTNLTQQLEQWKSIALKTISHPQIIKLIEDLMHEVFGRNTEIKTMTKTPIQVYFISIDFPTLRGFPGLNELLINDNYFSTKIFEWKSNTRLLNSITKMDLITIALHECAHVRIRQQVDDINMSPRKMLQFCQIKKPKCDQEFGCGCECFHHEQSHPHPQDELLPYNLVPVVVPELKSLTVGRVLAGTGLESSSFLYGQFGDSLIEATYILSDG